MRTTSRFRRTSLFRTVALGITLTASLLAGTGPSQAAAAPAVIDEIANPAQFSLTKQHDYASEIAKLKTSSTLQTVANPLSVLAGSGHTGKKGLCYPTPFHPGIDADGYCWNNQDDSTGGDDMNWAPQGFSLRDGDPNWQAVTWHAKESKDIPAKDRFARITFVDRSSGTPRFNHVLLVVPGVGAGFQNDGIHADGVVWKGDRITIGTGHRLLTYDLNDLMKVNTISGQVGIWDNESSAKYHNYILPLRTEYSTANGTKCAAVTGTTPCLTSLSYDSTGGGSLISTEYVQDKEDGRIIRWPYNFVDGSQATAAWKSPIHSQQGAVYAEGNLFISGSCPTSFVNGSDHATGIDSCIHKAVPGQAPHVLTAAPDMTQNLSYDTAAKRIWGINERHKAGEPRRVVFSVKTTPTPVAAVRFKNIGSDKCLMPYGGSLYSGTNAIQWACTGAKDPVISPMNWYWDGKTIRNFSSRQCLTVQGASKSNGAQITQWPCNGDTAQNWTLRKNQAGGGAQIVNENSNLCLTTQEGSTANGANVVQWVCDPLQLKHSWNGG